MKININILNIKRYILYFENPSTFFPLSCSLIFQKLKSCFSIWAICIFEIIGRCFCWGTALLWQQPSLRLGNLLWLLSIWLALCFCYSPRSLSETSFALLHAFFVYLIALALNFPLISWGFLNALALFLRSVSLLAWAFFWLWAFILALQCKSSPLLCFALPDFPFLHSINFSVDGILVVVYIYIYIYI